MGANSTLIALADPEQRIFDFIGADPARLDHFKELFHPTEFDLSGDNHRSNGTDIVAFGNDVLAGKFRDEPYIGVKFDLFEPNPNQAFTKLTTHTLQARKRLIDSGKKGWSLAVLVPTRRMTRQVSDSFRAPMGTIPPIRHYAAVDMEAAILGAEIVALLLQPHDDGAYFAAFVELLCGYFQGRDGDAPSQKSLREAKAIQAASAKCAAMKRAGKLVPAKSIFVPIQAAYDQACALVLTGDPDADWIAVRKILESGICPRMKEIAEEVRNIRLLDRGTQLRQALSQDWRDYGVYRTLWRLSGWRSYRSIFRHLISPKSASS